MIETEPRKYIPIAYDFDMSGFVNPPYATINPTLGITTVQQRIYRGYCRNTHVMQFVRSKFLNLEAKIWDVMNRYETEIHPKTFANRKKFLEEFFRILKNDRSFTENILNKCRKK